MPPTSSNSRIKPVRVRFAPSPTGTTHLGSARTALYNYLLAQQTSGQFILRFEDTDRKRLVPEAEKDLIDSLKWLGLQWDEGPDIGGPFAPYRQSERKEIYQQHAEELINKGHAFYCFCTREELEAVRKEQIKNQQQPQYAGPCRNYNKDEAKARVAAGEEYVVRFKMPKEGSITGHDRLRGEITVQNSTLDDSVLLKSDGHALYHLAAMVDDHLMGITHVFRGEEWLPSLPLHAHIYRAFGWQEPEWVHLSVFLKPSGKGKMSKRDTEQMKLTGKSIFVKDLEAMGYLPEGVLNWMALMGWSYDDHTEFFTLQDLIEKFTIGKLNPKAAAIDYKKLDHFNGLHIRNLSVAELSERIRPYFEVEGYSVSTEQIAQITPIIQVRMTTLNDAPAVAGFFFQDDITPQPEDLIAKKTTAAESATAAKRAYEVLKSLADINRESTEPQMRSLADDLGLKAGQLFSILRVAVTGQKVSPPLFESMEIIGRETSIARLEQAIKMLEELANNDV
ncbi:MAG: glutamate--tRNA ligase [Chloroflexi bacterium]|nr:glutamate--tRNA ligase [Chloroflexota bacterium]